MISCVNCTVRPPRLMIAEINKFYRTDLIVMDATEGFTTGGPDKGKLIPRGLLSPARIGSPLTWWELPCSVHTGR